MIFKNNFSKLIWVNLFALACIQSGVSEKAFAKVRPYTPLKAKTIEAAYVKGLAGEVKFTLQNALALTAETSSIQFQDGQPTDSIEFYKSPRCYLHFKNQSQALKEIPSGQILKASKIDNIYQNGAVHVTFWFDNDPVISDLACITNYNHTLTSEELRSTLGQTFAVSITKSIEAGALFNTAPVKGVKALSEDASTSRPLGSARIILTDS
jgi:hypothetical protein